MNGKQRYIGLVIFLVAAISAMVWAYGFVTNRQQGPDGMSIGVVRIDDVLEFNPSYADYKQAKNELELLQRQYELEQQALNAKSETQDEQLKTLALDSTLSDALTVELQTRIATKENELNQQLNSKRNELTQKYLAELKVSTNEYDLEIVNLQLDLYAYDARVYIDDAHRAAAMAEKAKKEERLKDLLAKRKPSDFDVDSIKAKVQAELAPMQQKGQEELNQYAAFLQKELAEKRDSMVQQQAQAIIANNNLPVAQEWNDTWAKKLSDKEAEVSALHEAILIRSYIMNKRIKSLVLGASLVASMAILGGCGSNNVGYVDSVKVANSTEKGIEITKEINAKKAELDAKIAAADEASKQNVFNQANQELNAFANAKAQEYRQYQEQKINELVKEKKLDVIIEKGAVVGGGSDVTDDLITKMGKASDDQIKEVENAAKAQEQQDAQQNAQQADQAATSTTEAAQ